MTAILNPEPGRFICRGPGARANATVLAMHQIDLGLLVEVLDGESRMTVWGQETMMEKNAQRLIGAADVIIDVIP